MCMFCWSLFVLLYFGHCVVCSSSIKDSDNPFGIFKLFLTSIIILLYMYMYMFIYFWYSVDNLRYVLPLYQSIFCFGEVFVSLNLNEVIWWFNSIDLVNRTIFVVFSCMAFYWGYLITVYYKSKNLVIRILFTYLSHKAIWTYVAYIAVCLIR